MRKKVLLHANMFLLLGLLAAACGPGGNAAPTVDHFGRPGTPVYDQLIWDCNTGDALPADYSTDGPIQPDGGCDNWQINRYERPFNAESQDRFFPDLDIMSAELGEDGAWFYFRLTVFDQNDRTDQLDGTYAIEIDLDIDGRGDVLILANNPSEEALEDWSVAGVRFIGDDDNDVGDERPLVPDPPSSGDGFDAVIFDQGAGDDPDLAWVRVDLGKPAHVEIAFKASSILNDPTFKWWAWSDQGVNNPSGADYHDTFDHPEAGDPIEDQPFYPSQEINELDNTCASIWGGQPGDDPDLCVNDSSVEPPVFQPTPTEPIQTATETPEDETRTPTPTEPSETPCVAADQVSDGTPETCTPTATEATDTSTPSETSTPTETSTQPCVGLNNTAGIPNTCTPSPTPSPTPTETATYTATSCVPFANTAASIPNTCTPTPTETETPSATPTTCYSIPLSLVAVQISTCTPTTTPTPSETPTRCAGINPLTGQLEECTPTPVNCYGPITAAAANQITTCTPTATVTPTDCVVPYPFAVINCSPTPTQTPSMTPTLCLGVNPNTTAPVPMPCTPTPTECAVINLAAAAVTNCTPTPTPTLCVTGTLIGYDDAGAPIYAYTECTPTPTPTACFATDIAGALVPCTPTPVTAALMVFPQQNANCRRSNSNAAQIVDTLFEGEGYIPLGRGPDNLWMLFRGPATNVRCWAFVGLFDIPFGPLNEVPDSVLPYILYPTSTPTPTHVPANTQSPSAPECSDGIDNDGDGTTDYGVQTTGASPYDKDCSSASDNNESD